MPRGKRKDLDADKESTPQRSRRRKDSPEDEDDSCMRSLPLSGSGRITSSALRRAVNQASPSSSLRRDSPKENQDHRMVSTPSSGSRMMTQNAQRRAANQASTRIGRASIRPSAQNIRKSTPISRRLEAESPLHSPNLILDLSMFPTAGEPAHPGPVAGAIGGMSTPASGRLGAVAAVHPPSPMMEDALLSPIGRDPDHQTFPGNEEEVDYDDIRRMYNPGPVGAAMGGMSIPAAGRLGAEEVQVFEYSSEINDDPERHLSFDRKLSKCYIIFEKVCLHDMLLLLRVLARKRQRQGISINDGLRAARNGPDFDQDFVNVGDNIGSGMFGSAFIMKTIRGKRYVMKREDATEETGGFCMFRENLRRVLGEKNSMMIATEHSNMIHIKGAWMIGVTNGFVFYTIMEFADFGTLKQYMEKCRSQMVDLRSKEDEFDNYDVSLRPQLNDASNLIKEAEASEPVKRFGFRKILLQFSSEVISGVIFLHSQGISHNDLHDGNILIGSGFHIKISDFGATTINHPLYESGLFGKEDQIKPKDETVSVRMGEFQPLAHKYADKFALIQLLVLLTTGLDSDKIIRNKRSRHPHFHRPWNCIFLDDPFLRIFGNTVIMNLQRQNPYIPWSSQIEDMLIYFRNSAVAKPYDEYNPRDYVLLLYGQNNFTPALTSRLEVTSHEGDEVIVSDMDRRNRSSFAGIGYLDESFLREQGE